MRRTLSATSLALAALLGGVSVSPTVAAELPAQATIVVSDEQGAAIHGARLLVSVLPMNGEAFSRAKPREATTDEHGRAWVVLSLAGDDARAAAANNGWLNYSVVVVDRAGFVIGLHGFAKYLGQDASQREEARALGIDKPIHVTARVRIRDASLAAAQARLARMGSASTAAASAADTSVTPLTSGCTYYYWEEDVTSRTWAYTRIGELHVQSDYNDAYYEYGSSADSSIDIGYKSGGVWAVDGSVHVGDSLGTTYGQHASGTSYNWGVEAPFDFTTAYLYCDGTNGTHIYQGHEETWSPGYHNGHGLSKQIVISQPARNASYTTIMFADQSWHRYSSSFARVSGAVSLYGFSFGASTGATTLADVYYWFSHALNSHYIYGNNARPESSGKVYESSS
jgi:hypothetical protein